MKKNQAPVRKTENDVAFLSEILLFVGNELCVYESLHLVIYLSLFAYDCTAHKLALGGPVIRHCSLMLAGRAEQTNKQRGPRETCC
jgi:hypothetical protein